MANRSKQKRSWSSMFEREYLVGLVSLRMRRFMRQEARAEVITEKAYDWSVEEKRKHLRERAWLVLIGIACVVILTYFLAVPLAAVYLTQRLVAPSQVQDAYKRVIKTSITYVPAESAVKNVQVRELARGAFYEATMSTDMFVDRGLQGVFRMSIADDEDDALKPAVSILYRTQNDGTATSSAYVLFSEWPEMFQNIMPIPSGTSQWYRYEPQTEDQASPALDALLAMSSDTTMRMRDDFFKFLLEHAIDKKAVRLSFTSLPYKDADNRRVIRIDWSLNPARLPALMADLTNDPRYRPYASLMQSSVAGLPSLEEMSASLSALSGAATIGLWDRVVYDSSVYIGLHHPSFGHIRSRIESSVHPTDTIFDRTSPQKTIGFSALLKRMNAFLRLKFNTPTSTPSLTDDL